MSKSKQKQKRSLRTRSGYCVSVVRVPDGHREPHVVAGGESGSEGRRGRSADPSDPLQHPTVDLVALQVGLGQSAERLEAVGRCGPDGVLVAQSKI